MTRAPRINTVVSSTSHSTGDQDREKRRPIAASFTHRVPLVRHQSCGAVAVSPRLPIVAFVFSVLASAPRPSFGQAPVDAEVRAPPKHVAIEWNPLAAFPLLRASANVEVLVAEHHALGGNLAYEAFGSEVNGPIGEIGYRYYSGTGGLEGFFIGPSLIGGVLSYKPYCYSTPPPCVHGTAVMTGVAVDAGFQTIFSNQFVLGVGGGVAYLHADRKINFDGENPAVVLLATGFIPRILFSIGYAF